MDWQLSRLSRPQALAVLPEHRRIKVEAALSSHRIGSPGGRPRWSVR
jgi:hypothetical protein